MAVKKHGPGPVRIVAVHGGPGAAGSAGDLARALAERFGVGVLEPWQSRCSVAEQADELHEQIAGSCDAPPLVIGHSWGAWLAGLCQYSHPGTAGRLLLVGAGALDESWLGELVERRLAHFSETERVRYGFLCRALEDPEQPERDALLAELGALCESADDYEPLPDAGDGDGRCDGELYARVWPEAAALRRSGELLRRLAGADCPITVVHGREDTTPPESVIEPLRRAKAVFRGIILERCGHTPWRERHAREEFLSICGNSLPQPC